MRSQFQIEHTATLEEGKRLLEDQVLAREGERRAQEQELLMAQAALQTFRHQMEAERDAMKAVHVNEALELSNQAERQDEEESAEVKKRMQTLANDHMLALEQLHEQWQDS